MSSYVIWWIAAAVLVGVELATGTFYLLAIGAACIVGGIAAWLGFEAWVQFGVATMASLFGMMGAHRWRTGHAEPPQMTPFDTGQTVRVIEWKDGDTARVQYRGSQWDAVLATPSTPRHDVMVIKEMRGSVLVLTSPVETIVT